ncbi:hypothetical protein [Actinoplanes sp. NPDC089786]|uniref:hypothetical protein n=1 Tax=Actinoplanes sp. NPDC089786 TaxID=3155185 RepID=UPI00342E495D
MTTTSEAVSRAARPPRSWETQTVGVLVAIAASGLLGVILLATQVGLWAYLRNGGTTTVSALVVFVIDNAGPFDVLYVLLVIAYLGAYFWWRHQTREMLRRIGDFTGGATVHWAVVAWGLLLGAGFYMTPGISTTGTTADELATMFGWFAVRTVLRLAALGMLFLGVRQIRDQVRREVATSGVALRLGELGGERTARTTPLLAPIAAAATDHLPVADDEFWAKAGRLAAERNADLAVLEAVDVVARRWALIPAGGDATAVRAAIPAGAVVTVFPVPPAQTEIEGYEPPAADAYHGFLEDGASGALWFQSVTPKRVPAFLARARNARRWALYPVDAADALTAVASASAER